MCLLVILSLNRIGTEATEPIPNPPPDPAPDAAPDAAPDDDYATTPVTPGRYGMVRPLYIV